MSEIQIWQLPDGIDEVLPNDANVLESLKRELLDLYASWGYRLVIPPLVEFAESLLVGLGADLDLLTCKIPDQLSGRMLGVRADITPQAARIDAHSMNCEGVNRLCYAGPILHAKPKSSGFCRSPIQLGAELFGDDSVHADVEVIDLMLETLEMSGLSSLAGNIILDLGHVGIVQSLLDVAQMEKTTESRVFGALQRKSIPDLEDALLSVNDPYAETFLTLAKLNGDSSVLEEGRKLVSKIAPEALKPIDLIDQVIQSICKRRPSLSIYIDLAELRGYNYHTGIVFSAYTHQRGQSLANGGRYDNVGSIFGRSRAATGFGVDLKRLMDFYSSKFEDQRDSKIISAPYSDDPVLRKVVTKLRKQGECVVTKLPGDKKDSTISHQLVSLGDEWVVEAVKTE